MIYSYNTAHKAIDFLLWFVHAAIFNDFSFDLRQETACINSNSNNNNNNNNNNINVR
jgi:hypothetical protein